jgi:hypothetical protein
MDSEVTDKLLILSITEMLEKKGSKIRQSLSYSAAS